MEEAAAQPGDAPPCPLFDPQIEATLDKLWPAIGGVDHYYHYFGQAQPPPLKHAPDLPAHVAQLADAGKTWVATYRPPLIAALQSLGGYGGDFVNLYAPELASALGALPTGGQAAQDAAVAKLEFVERAIFAPLGQLQACAKQLAAFSAAVSAGVAAVSGDADALDRQVSADQQAINAANQRGQALAADERDNLENAAESGMLAPLAAYYLSKAKDDEEALQAIGPQIQGYETDMDAVHRESGELRDLPKLCNEFGQLAADAAGCTHDLGNAVEVLQIYISQAESEIRQAEWVAQAGASLASQLASAKSSWLAVSKKVAAIGPAP